MNKTTFTFAQAVKHYRTERGWNFARLAAEIAVATDMQMTPASSVVRKWESGTQPILQGAIVASKVLGFSLDSLSLS